MRTINGLLWIVFVLALIASLLVPGVWFYTAAHLPNSLESAADIELHLRKSIESERQSIQYNKRQVDRDDVSWPRPDFSTLPRPLVALYVTETGCPTYFDTPRDSALEWNKRVMNSLMDKQMDGDGACELIFARRLARRLGAKSPMQIAVAADRVHAFLKKDELVAFDLHSMQFDQGLIGVEAAGPVLLQRKLLEMNLAELAEFQLGIPPHDYWEDVRICKNASLLKQSRDNVLDRLARMGHVTTDASAAAIAVPVRCLSVKR